MIAVYSEKHFNTEICFKTLLCKRCRRCYCLHTIVSEFLKWLLVGCLLQNLQNPLFTHPSDEPLSLSVPKLQGANDYRTWKRSFEIQLLAKRKLGFVDGTITRNTTNASEASQWDTCNNLVIFWIQNNIYKSIKPSVLYINNACEIWKQLEKQFSLTNVIYLILDKMG